MNEDTEDQRAASARARLAELQDSRVRLEDEKLALWSHCAEVRAESLRRGELSGPLTRSDRRMQHLLEQRNQRCAELTERVDTYDENTQPPDEALKALQQSATHARQQLDAAQAALSGRLSSDRDYQRLLERQSEIHEALSGLDQRLEHAIAERDRKSASYMNDPLFRYLRNRGYGTRDYRRQGLAYRMDRWIAAVAGYEQALGDYELLQDMPRWLAEVIDETNAQASAVEAEISDYRHQQPESEPLKRLETEACQANSVLENKKRSLAEAETAQRSRREELEAIQQGVDADSIAIRDSYRNLFADQPIPALLKLAEQTATGLDQAALRRIEQIERRQTRIDGLIEQLREDTAQGEDAGSAQPEA